MGAEVWELLGRRVPLGKGRMGTRVECYPTWFDYCRLIDYMQVGVTVRHYYLQVLGNCLNLVLTGM